MSLNPKKYRQSFYRDKPILLTEERNPKARIWVLVTNGWTIVYCDPSPHTFRVHLGCNDVGFDLESAELRFRPDGSYGVFSGKDQVGVIFCTGVSSGRHKLAYGVLAVSVNFGDPRRLDEGPVLPL